LDVFLSAAIFHEGLSAKLNQDCQSKSSSHGYQYFTLTRTAHTLMNGWGHKRHYAQLFFQANDSCCA